MDKLFGSGIFHPGTSLPSSPGPPSPRRRKKNKQECKVEAKCLAQEQLQKEWEHPSLRIRREPSYTETNPLSPNVEYFLTNPYGAGSSTSVYRDPVPINESDEEVEPPPVSPLLSNFTWGLLPLPPVPPEDLEELSSEEEIDRTQAMDTIMTELQLQAIVMAAIRAVNGDERNLKPPNKKCSLAKPKTLQTLYKNANLGSKFTLPHTPMQSKRCSTPFL